ncbi:hypothetical protein PNA2_1917 [Pyrococcus sp. NA2]|uniref:hypothetical protein n=1 Tax=Pyrococcus sp. (strain NA2) TaxID=342949 RepID=UPI000209AD89|nr:hypothetical protein [Pyrococcus sp. NA2]AEC52831.1 hypothetical protein PNA2_1917 [Pyrococcus sp. NA2]
MKKGQLLSLDALLSLIIVTFMIASIINVSSEIKGEIVSIVEWFGRSNIAENMIDVLVESPGEPENWEDDINSIRIVGLGNTFGEIDYEKLKKFIENINNPKILSSLYNLSLGRNFLMEVYLSSLQVNVSGKFPEVYVDGMTFSNPSGNPPGVNFRISSQGNKAFRVTYLELIRDGIKYVNRDVLDLTRGSTLNLMEGDKIRFIIAEDVTLTVRRASGGGTIFERDIPAEAFIEITVRGPEVSNFKITFQGGNWDTFKFTGIGNVIVTVTAYSTSHPTIIVNKTFYTDLLRMRRPTKFFALINGTLITNETIILTSMNRSEWIEPAYRIVIIKRIEYDLSKEPSKTDPLVYGTLPKYHSLRGLLKISVPGTEGNLTLVTISGSDIKGIFVYKETSNDIVKAVIIDKNATYILKGNTTSVSIPLNKIFENKYNNEIVGMWLYSCTWNRERVKLEISPSMRWTLKPVKDLAMIRLVVWG